MAAAFPQRPPRQRRTNAANGLPRHQEQSLARHATENIPYLVLDARLLSWYVVRGRAQSARPKSIPALAAPVELTTTRHPGLHEPPPTAQAPSHDSVAPSITRSGRHPGSPTYKYVASVEFTSYSYTSMQLGPPNSAPCCAGRCAQDIRDAWPVDLHVTRERSQRATTPFLAASIPEKQLKLLRTPNIQVITTTPNGT